MSHFTLYKWLHRPLSIMIIRHWLAFSCSLTCCFKNHSMCPPQSHLWGPSVRWITFRKSRRQFKSVGRRQKNRRPARYEWNHFFGLSATIVRHSSHIIMQSVQIFLFSNYCTVQSGSMILWFIITPSIVSFLGKSDTRIEVLSCSTRLSKWN